MSINLHVQIQPRPQRISLGTRLAQIHWFWFMYQNLRHTHAEKG